MKTYITLFIMTCSLCLDAQTHWLEASLNQGDKVTLHDHISDTKLSVSNSQTLINYNPCITLSKPVELSLSDRGLAQTSIFTVYRPTLNTNEELIWQIQNQHTDQLLLTDERVADFSEGRFMNFLDHNPREAQINSYQHYRKSFDSDGLIIAGNPSNSEVPLRPFQGELAEMIVFDHKLAPIAQQIVESHLALKYSVPLSTGLDYVDDQGRPIWKYETHKSYSHNIAGLGRNDELHLHQRQSRSKFGEGSISLAYGDLSADNPSNPSQLNNQEYLLWGDDDGLLDLEEKYNEVFQLSRSWKLISQRFDQSKKLAFLMDHEGIAGQVSEDEILWLMLSAEEIEHVQLPTSVLYPLTKTEAGFSAADVDISGMGFFTLLRSPKLWLQLEPNGPACGSDESGSIDFRPVGGIAPYQVSLYDLDDNLLQVETLDYADIASFDDLLPAQYRIAVSDSRDRNWSTEIYLSSTAMPVVDLPIKLILDPRESIFLDAKIDTDEQIDYRWTLPDGSTSSDVQIKAKTAGSYSLQLTIDDCHAWHEVEIVKPERNITFTQVNPNPTVNGYFTFRAEMKEAAPYSIVITTVDGKVVMQQDFNAAKYVSFDGRLEKGGMYLITLRSGASVETEKVVVVR